MRIIEALVRGMANALGRRSFSDRMAIRLVLVTQLLGVSTTLEDSWLDSVFNATAYSETAVYLSLHTADPGATGASEATGGSYARQAIPAVASSGGYTSNADIDFTDMPAATLTHVGVWDAATVGNFLIGGALSASKTTNSGDTFRVASGNLTCNIS